MYLMGSQQICRQKRWFVITVVEREELGNMLPERSYPSVVIEEKIVENPGAVIPPPGKDNIQKSIEDDKGEMRLYHWQIIHVHLDEHEQ